MFREPLPQTTRRHSLTYLYYTFRLDWTAKAYSDLIELWSFPPDLETLEQANLEMSHFQWAGVSAVCQVGFLFLYIFSSKYRVLSRMRCLKPILDSSMVAERRVSQVVAWWQVNMSPRRRRSAVELTFGVSRHPCCRQWSNLSSPSAESTFEAGIRPNTCADLIDDGSHLSLYSVLSH